MKFNSKVTYQVLLNKISIDDQLDMIIWMNSKGIKFRIKFGKFLFSSKEDYIEFILVWTDILNASFS